MKIKRTIAIATIALIAFVALALVAARLEVDTLNHKRERAVEH